MTGVNDVNARKANKGEWSELYVLLRLLADGKLYAADAELQRLEHVYTPILRIFRKETETRDLVYKLLAAPNKEVRLYINEDLIKSISSERLAEYSETCLNGIRNGTNSFSFDGSEEILNDLCCTTIKSRSDDKTDILIEIHDYMTGYNRIVGYSIKSRLGGAPTLLNASGSTNFRYTVSGIDDKLIGLINEPAKISDRIKMIEEYGSIRFEGADNSTFAGNLKLIDSNMEAIIAQMLLEHYKSNIHRCSDIATSLEDKDPLNIGVTGFYRYKIKKLLCAVALGLVPSTEWNGIDEANGGYIIVKESGDVVSYHLYDRSTFEAYLLNNTRMETASTSRHGFGQVYSEATGMKIKLNLQIRFI